MRVNLGGVKFNHLRGRLAIQQHKVVFRPPGTFSNFSSHVATLHLAVNCFLTISHYRLSHVKMKLICLSLNGFLMSWIQITKKDKNAQKTSLSSSTHTGAEELKRKHKKSTTTTTAASPWIEFLLIFLLSFFLFIVDAELSLSSFSSSPVGAPIGNEDYMRMKRDGIRWGFGFWSNTFHLSLCQCLFSTNRTTFVCDVIWLLNREFFFNSPECLALE